MNGIAPNKAMKARHNAMREIGCILCKREGYIYSPTQIHHINGCKTQKAHAETLGLCDKHHIKDQQYKSVEDYTSRHPYKKRFEKRYGTEKELLYYQNRLLNGED